MRKVLRVAVWTFWLAENTAAFQAYAFEFELHVLVRLCLEKIELSGMLTSRDAPGKSARLDAAPGIQLAQIAAR